MIAYAITDPLTLDFRTLHQDLQLFSQKADMILYRDKKNANYANDAHAFVREASQHGFKEVLVHREPQLAKALGASGVHLSSDQISQISLAKELGLFVVVSTHSLAEIRASALLGADMVTFSPIFFTPDKGVPKGIVLLKEVVKESPLPIIALGGILSSEEVDACKEAGAAGFASIRYFKTNKG